MMSSLTKLLLLVMVSSAASHQSSPIAKVIQLLSDLQAKVIKEGEAAHKTFEEYSEWCEDRSKNIDYDIKTGENEVGDLKAAIEQAVATSTELNAKIEETANSIATNDADLKAASTIRATEEKDFKAEQKELQDVISALDRAILILEREATKSSSSMLQINQAKNLAQAFSIMVQASLLGSADAAKLTALVQSGQNAKDDEFDLTLGAPEAAAYQSHSGTIIDTLEDLLAKAKEQLGTAQKKEINSKHNFEMLKQSLEDEIKFSNQDLDKAKKDLASTTEAKATAEGDLAVTAKTLKENKKTKSSLKTDCMTKSQDYEAATKSRAEELKAIAEAKKVLVENTGAAGDLTYSFLQVVQHDASDSELQTGADLANFEAVRFVRNLARKEHDDALMQLSRRMAAAMRYGDSSGADPFAKVKGLIRDMIENLEKDAAADAQHKAYCDKEMGETLAKKADKEAAIDKLSTQIDTKSSRSATLQEEIASLQRALAKLASAQAEMTKIRQAEKAEFEANAPDMKAGLQAVKMAIQILREYYAKDNIAHTAAEGAGTGIIGLLEVVESDFSKTLAEMSATEAAAQRAYDR